ncbi:molybdopterin-binding protein [Clostridium sp. BJN0013]|uniref:molybdopterin-binding protein n=1 Tax=Clostridium sp. BJN0013 TaxID=3236840 RepID=UPI0034C66E6C
MIDNCRAGQNYYDGLEYFCPWVRYHPNAYYPPNVTAEMALSARNQFKGRVVKINKGDVVGQVLIDIGCGNSISSVITTASIRDLRLSVGSQVRAIVKSTNVMIMDSSSNMTPNSNIMPNPSNKMPNSNNIMPNSNKLMPNSNKLMPNSNVKSDKEKSKMALSARNQLKGKVTKITQGDVVSQVLIDIGCRNSVSSVITTTSLKDLGIKLGSEVKAVIKSTDVMIMK